jgi:pimeloyl-ACP methyl ester carboxylesterase
MPPVTPLVFLHGVGGGHAAWQAQVAHFSGLGYPCLAWDQPGYGSKALVEPYSFAGVVDSLAKELDYPPVVLVGHSMGGLVAQEFYARYPRAVKALALCFTSATFGGSDEFARQFIAARIGPLDEGKTMAQVAASVMPAMRGTRSDPSGLSHAQRIMAGIAPETYRKAVSLLTTFDRRADLERIAVPTLLLAGSEDKTAPPSVMARMAEKIPGATFEVLEGCGHLGPMDQPEAFNGVLERFLRKNGL